MNKITTQLLAGFMAVSMLSGSAEASSLLASKTTAPSVEVSQYEQSIIGVDDQRNSDSTVQIDMLPMTVDQPQATTDVDAPHSPLEAEIEAGNKTGVPAGPAAETSTTYDIASGKLSSQVLMRAGDGYSDFRIPSLVATSKGTLLALAEARTSGSDWAPMDAVLMRSTDGGETWEERKIVAAGREQGFACNNPILIATREGPIFFIYCKEYGVESRAGGVFYRKSIDDGVTWSDPVDISSSCVPDYRNVIATGPGHGIQLRNGRLIAPVWMVPKSAGKEPTSHHPGEVSTLYSDDMGQTWHIGEIITGMNNSDLVDPNESTIVELSDGRVMINMRNQTGTGLRAISISPNGSSDWSTPYFDEALRDPICFGSLVRYDENTILFVNPDTTSGRTHGTVKVSYDDGKTWPVKRELNPGRSAYADIAVSTVNGIRQINVLMETDPGNTLTLYRFPLSWLEGNSSHELKRLKISNKNLQLQQGVYEYEVPMRAATERILIEAEAFDAQAQITCNGEPFENGKLELPLSGTDTKVVIKLTFQDGVELSYTVTLKKSLPVSQQSCVLHYSLDDVNGGQVDDISGYQNNATVNGSITFTNEGKFNGGAVMGDGETFFQIQNPRGLDFGTNDFTASVWVKPASLQGQQFLFWYGSYGAGANAWWCRLNGTGIDFLLGDQTESWVSAANVLTLNTWAHIVLVNEQNTLKLYVDGVLKGTQKLPKDFNVNGENVLRIGAQKSGNKRIFKGIMDEIQIFNYALSAEQIADLNSGSEITSSAKDILLFSANGKCGEIKGTEIRLYQPDGTDVTAITPDITVSANASISPESGVPQDFTNPVKYTVTAQDGTQKTYTVTVVIGEAPPKEEIVYVQPEPVKVYPTGLENANVVKINFLGDSITYGQDPRNPYGAVKQYHAYLADQLQIDNKNYGIRGSTISVLRRGGDRDPFTVRYQQMREDADIVFVFGGTNDYGVATSAPFGTWQDTEDTTFLGGLRVLIEGLIQKYPDKQIVFMTPIRRGDRNGVNGVRKTLSQYVSAIKAMCGEYGIPVLDAYSAPEMNLLVDKQLYIADGLHPSAAGHEVMGRWIYDQLQEKNVIQVVVPVTGVQLSAEQKEMTVDESFTLTATVLPENATEKNVTWDTDTPNVVQVDKDGVVTALAAGKATVTVSTVDGQFTSKCQINVSAAEPSYDKDTIIESDLKTAKHHALMELAKYANDKDCAQIVAEATKAINAAATTEEVRQILAAALKELEAIKATHLMNFNDVKEGEWYYDAVKYMVNNGHMAGISKTEFGINRTLTRAQLVTILYRVAGAPSVTGMQKPFTDVENGTWYTDAVIWAANEKVVSGMTTTLFAPNNAITREQLVSILYRYAGAVSDANGIEKFADADKVSAYAKEAMSWAIENGILCGMEQNGNIYLNPMGNATRAECAAVLQRFLEKI